MANAYQRAASRRKLIYFGSIIGLLVVSLFARGIVRLEDEVPAWTVRGQAERLEITERGQGDPELAGATVRLLLTGSRGLAVCALWISAMDKQSRHEWSELELLVNSMTKLQPHFMTPWLYQSWNLTYNVSVELDRLNDMYFYISRGIKLLSEGESRNKNNPDMRYWIAFYYQNKFGVSDKVKTLRCLYELSCIPLPDRDYRKFTNPDRSVNLTEFRKFCETNPQLVRRLRENLACYYPEDVIRFLKDNEKVPTRYRERTKELLDRMDQFPVLPPWSTEKEQSPGDTITDGTADGYLAARSWFRYSLEPLPPPMDVPGPTVNPDPRRYRIPRSPMMIIFRQGAPRAQEYVAERLQAEGWLDAEPWVVDEKLAGADRRWFPDDVRLAPTDNSKRAWVESFNAWKEHGRANGLDMSEEQKATLIRRAQLFADMRGSRIGGPSGQLRPDEEKDPEIKASFEAHQTLHFLEQNLFVTQFSKHLLRSEVEMDDRTIQARKLLAKAELNKQLAQPSEALEAYEQAFDLWKVILREREDARMIDPIQEELYENELRYDSLLRQERDGGARRKGLLAASEVAAHAADVVGGGTPRLVSGPYVLRPLSRKLDTFPIPGPLDGTDDKGRPWIRPDIRDRVGVRHGNFRTRSQQPDAGASAEAAPKGKE